MAAASLTTGQHVRRPPCWGLTPRPRPNSTTRSVAVRPCRPCCASKCPFARPGEPSPLAARGVQGAHASLWLSLGVPGQDTAGRLVSGLRRLRDPGEELLIERAEEMPYELGLKRRAYDDPERHDKVFAALPRSLPAQAEALDLLLRHLPARFPELYAVEGQGASRAVRVLPTGERHVVSQYADAPLELAARIVQEDLVLMESGEEDGAPYVMTAAAVLCSFGGLDTKLGAPLGAIHVPVPGFEAELLDLVERTFASLQPERPLWRNNWGFSSSAELDNPKYGTAESQAVAAVAAVPPQGKMLKTEYQTLQRLPETGAVLFTVRTMMEPLAGLGAVPGAAAVLAESLRRLSPGMHRYKGLDPAGAREMVEYVDQLAERAGR
mmetsp:Transcript_23551/g.60437  ORF Transcript_23551/g.60437 Transcript_23551/m.60437 type:complete len:381 (+) Transcript_23551:260-1402(+)